MASGGEALLKMCAIMLIPRNAGIENAGTTSHLCIPKNTLEGLLVEDEGIHPHNSCHFSNQRQ